MATIIRACPMECKCHARDIPLTQRELSYAEG